MMLAVGQNPRTILTSVFPTTSGIVLLDPTGQIISMPDVESACLKTLKYVDVIHQNGLLEYAHHVFFSYQP